MRILHLIDPASPGGGPGTLRLVAEAVLRTTAARHDVLIVGNRGHRELARRCGLTTRGRLGCPLNRAALAREGLRSFLRACEPVCGRYDLLHAWTLSAAGLAVLAAGRRRVLATAMVPAAGWTVRRRLRTVPVLAASAAVGRELESAGWDPALLSVLPPGVDRQALGIVPRALLRERWGADETTFVTGLLGEPAARLDGAFAMNALGRVALAGKDMRLVLHHEATAPDDLRRWLGRLGLGDLIVVDDAAAEPWRVVGGLDAAIVAARFSARAPALSCTPVLWAMAAGVPVVAESTPAIRGVVEDGVAGLLFAPGDPNSAAARLLHVHDHGRDAARIGDAARALIERHFGITEFITRLAAVYEQHAAGEPIRVPDTSTARSRADEVALTGP